MFIRHSWVVLLLTAAALTGQERPAQAAGETGNFPVKRVVLYKNGVGYFEHLGRVQGSQEVGIRFTSGQLNDVLKSLTVLDLSGGRIAGVTYGSPTPLDRRLGELRLPTGEKTTLTEFLGGLRGARLEIRNGTNVVTGRLLSVERKTRMGQGTTLEVDYVSLITDSGEVKTAEVSPSFSVRLVERELAGTVNRYMNLLSSARDADLRRMAISTAGTGDRSLFVSYISEVPVWKTTYRIVLSSKPAEKPLLQGWAIVDNTVGEDWEKIELSLVAGAPHSFIQHLSQPYYSRRPVIGLPEATATAPQTHEATLFRGGGRVAGMVTDPTGLAVAGARVRAFDMGGAPAGETTADAAGRYKLDSLPAGQVRLEIQATGFRTTVIHGVAASAGGSNEVNARLEVGDVAETLQVTASAGLVETSESMARSGSTGSGRMLGRGSGSGTYMPGSGPNNGRGFGSGMGAGFGPGSGGGVGSGAYNVADARARAEAAALAQDLGDLFEYKLKEPITILKNQSALVPILQTPLEIEKVSLWNASAGGPKPQRALWIHNSNEPTLDGGSFSVLEKETFAGEGIFDPIRPGEKRLVSYATDLALNASSRQETEHRRVTRVRVKRGVMIHESERIEKTSYTFRNEDASARNVIIEHPVRPGYEIRGDARPVEETRAWMRFRLPVEPKKTASLTVEEGRPVEASYTLSKINNDQIAAFLKDRTLSKELEDALRRIIDQQNVVAALKDRKSNREAGLQGIFDDQERLRENMKSLKGSAGEKALLQRYTRQLNDQEDRLAELRKEIEGLQKEIDNADEELDRRIEEPVFDIKI